jgi:hypothetical protein
MIDPSQNAKIIQSDMDLQYIQQDGQFLYKTIGYEELTKYPKFTAKYIHQKLAEEIFFLNASA